MKALRAIGFGRALRFLGSLLAEALLRHAALPPVRSILLRLLGASIGPNSVIYDFSIMNLYRGHLSNLRVGANCFIGQECLVDLADRVEIGDHVTIAGRTMILTHLNVGYEDHPLQAHFSAHTAPVTIEEGCFIGAHCTILAGVTVGAGSLVAAGAVVAKDVLPHSVIGGVPAKVLRKMGGGDR